MGQRRSDGTGRGTRPVLWGAVFAVIVAGGALGGYALADGGGTSADGKPPLTDLPPSPEGVRTAARAFLDAWQRGDTGAAAAGTDDAKAARAALTGYREEGRIAKVRLTPGRASGSTVPFSVKAEVSYGGKRKPLAYESKLSVVRRPADGKVLVGWAPSVLHPQLRGEHDRLLTGEAGTPPVKAVDRDGKELDTKKFPSLANVVDGLREKYGEKSGGQAGIELRAVHGEEDGKDKKGAAAAGRKRGKEDQPDTTLLTLSEGTPGTVRTTLSATSQAAAEKEVASRKKASVVVLRPSTGEILAVANSEPAGFNTALQGSLAPGSTMKVITSSMLLEKKLAEVNRKHPCPKYFTYGGWKFQNDDKFEIKDGPFLASFARSCNTAFISQAPKLSDGDLTAQAQEVFGLGRDNWAIGVPSFDGAVPVQSDAQMAASLIGQGAVRMNPLNMASVAATASTGTFRQPYLVSPELDNRALAKASRTMASGTVKSLRELMRYTATSGTAAQAMASVGGDMGAKTGSAEVDGQQEPNGWFTAYKGDLAASAVVQAGGHGGDSAGPVVAAVLRAGG
ncbi:penicillin-binding transpeptidase domain-containing protein [Streptomyces physcomitrii]|uniref:penicillin-binding transpeptidase domain-containing protein n=1 Tax=Streptomyces physcomitrii TaxID=2724184 RepID=UPI00340BB462